MENDYSGCCRWTIQYTGSSGDVFAELAHKVDDGSGAWGIVLETREYTIEFPTKDAAFVIRIRDYLVQNLGKTNFEVPDHEGGLAGKEPVLTFSPLPSLEWNDADGVSLVLSKCPEFGGRFTFRVLINRIDAVYTFTGERTGNLVAAFEDLVEKMKGPPRGTV